MSQAETGRIASVFTLKQVAMIFFQMLLFLALYATVLFGSAGRWDIPAFWICWMIWTTFIVVGTVIGFKTDPSLVKERMRPGPGGKDPYLRLFAMVFFTAHWIVAGLDVGRYQWFGRVPGEVQAVGMVVLAGALSLSAWAMGVNRFFSSEARIQRDRGHYVITAGPYRFIRHPGYLAAITMSLASPLALGSYVSALPVLPLIPFFIRRLRIEEGLLFPELEGYAEYAQRVRYRLLPGIW